MPRRKRTVPWMERRGDPDNGILYACWYDAAARRVRGISLRTNIEAKAAPRFAEFLVDGADIRKPRVSGLTVSQGLDDYYEEHVLAKCADPARQRDAIVHLKLFFGERSFEDINVPLSREYAKLRYDGIIGGGQRRRSAKASPATVRRELNVLVAAANHAVWMERSTAQVKVDLPPERRLGPDEEAPYYTKEELEAIFAAADEAGGEMELFVKLLYFTAARRRSIENLTRERVRLPQRRIILQDPNKRSTKKRQPIVPILRTMLPLVERLLETGGEQKLFRCADFYRPYCALVASVEVGHNRAPILKDRHNPHIMRHTRATHLLQEGKSLYDVARLLGDTVATVERVYGHHSHEHLAQNLED